MFFKYDIPRKPTVRCSVSDPDPHRSAFILVGWMRILIRFGSTDPDPDPGGQKGPPKIEKREEFLSFGVLDGHS